MDSFGNKVLNESNLIDSAKILAACGSRNLILFYYQVIYFEQEVSSETTVGKGKQKKS